MHLLNVVLFFLKQIEKIKMAPRLFQKSFSIMKMVNVRHMSSRSKIYELRTYSIKPECMKPFLELTFENFHLRTEVSKLHGYWTAELGGLNQVVHIWEYGKKSGLFLYINLHWLILTCLSICIFTLFTITLHWLIQHLKLYVYYKLDYLGMDYVRHGEIQGRSLVFFKALYFTMSH